MPTLTVTEKEHWKERIGRRIDKRIETVCASEPNFMDRIQRAARQRALGSLGLADFQVELDRLDEQEKELDRRRRQAHKAMHAAVRRVAIEEVDDYYVDRPSPEVSSAVQRRQAVHEEELLAEDELGREVLRLRHERENLLDTVWLATSGQQIRDLWQKVLDLLGEEQTQLQKAALSLQAGEA